MKARLPQGMGGGGAANLQQLARQAQKMQEQMEQITTELEAKEYTAAAGGGAVSATVTGKMEVKNIDIKPEVIDPDDPRCSATSSLLLSTKRCAQPQTRKRKSLAQSPAA